MDTTDQVATRLSANPDTKVTAVLVMGDTVLAEGTEDHCREYMVGLKNACLNTWFPELNAPVEPESDTIEITVSDVTISDEKWGPEVVYTGDKTFEPLTAETIVPHVGKVTWNAAVGCLVCGNLSEYEDTCSVCGTEDFAHTKLDGDAEGEAVRCVRHIAATINGLAAVRLGPNQKGPEVECWRHKESGAIVRIRSLENMEVTSRDPKWEPRVSYVHDGQDAVYSLTFFQFLSKYEAVRNAD